LFGLENLQDDKINCCLKYKIVKIEKYIDVYLNFTSEDYYEFYDKYENAVSKKILVNPMYNNENLYMKHGLIFDNKQENIFDFYYLKAKDLNSFKFRKISFEEEKTFNSTILRVSCSHYDFNNLVYFFKNYSNGDDLYQINLKNVINLFSEKIFVIDSLFEQGYEREAIEEVREAFKFLINKKNFFLKIIYCLQNTLSNKLSEENNKENFEYSENSKKNIKKEEF
jgi:hypothetical protein